MGIIETTDSDLARLLHACPKALVMFTARHCAACEQLRPVLELFATNQAYAGIAFLRLNADQYPGGRQWMNQHEAPYFASYSHGQLVLGDTLHTEQQVRGMLHALHHHL